MLISLLITAPIWISRFSESIMSFVFALVFPVILMSLIVWRLYKLWKNYFLARFTSWGFIIFSNLFTGYDYETDQIYLKDPNRKKQIPRLFTNFINPDLFKIETNKKTYKFKTIGTNYRIKYNLTNYKCTYQKDQTLYFIIILMQFSNLSFLYLSLPPHVKISDLIKLKIKLPYYYSSKVPITRELLSEIADYSNTLLQYKDKLPYLFNYSKIFTLNDLPEEALADLDEKVRDVYKIIKFKSLEGFDEFESLFSTPIWRKAKNNFYNLYQPKNTVFTIPDRHNLVRFGFHLYQIDRDFFHYLVNHFYYLSDYWHIEVQDLIYLFKFIQFLDWIKGNMTVLSYTEIGEMCLSMTDILINLETNYNAEFELNKFLENATILGDKKKMEASEGDHLLRHLTIHRIAIYELKKFVIFLEEFRDQVARINEDRKLVANIIDRIGDANRLYQKIFNTKHSFFNATTNVIAELIRPVTKENFPNKIGTLSLLFETNTTPIKDALQNCNNKWGSVTLIKEWCIQENLRYSNSMIKTWREIIALRNSMVPFHNPSKKMFEHLKYFNIISLENYEKNWQKIQKKFQESLQEFVFSLEIKLFSKL